MSAPNVVLVHNHPRRMRRTKQAVEAGQLLGIEVLDHIVIGRGQFVSMKYRDVM